MLWFLAVILAVFAVAALSRRMKQRAAVAGLRREFPRIARMRLIAACPALEGVLDETSLRMLFDWMLTDMLHRANVSSFGELMHWAAHHGQRENDDLVIESARKAVDRMPRPVRQALDDCGGRSAAAVIVSQALTEAGTRITPELENYV